MLGNHRGKSKDPKGLRGDVVMKNHVLLLCALLTVTRVQISGYPQRIKFSDNVIKNKGATSVTASVAPCVPENRENGRTSRVQLVNGKDAFQYHVLDQSQKKPAVVKFFSDSADSARVKDHFQETADVFGDKINFFAVDIAAQNNGAPENQDIVAQLMMLLGITKVDLPLFFFFKNGNLCSPSPMLQGFYTKENLEAFIKNKFFMGKPAIMSPGQGSVQQSTSSFLDNSVTYPHDDK